MELKLLPDPVVNIIGHRSNRTFMELKYDNTIITSLKMKSSNRTFMELKLQVIMLLIFRLLQF